MCPGVQFPSLMVYPYRAMLGRIVDGVVVAELLLR